jgi:hypothetical protein
MNSLRGCGGRRWVVCGRAAAVWLALYGCASRPVLAGDLDYGLGYIGEHSTNIAQVPEGEQSAWTHSAIAGVGYRETSRELTAGLRAQAEYRTYYPELYQNGMLYFLDGSAIWSISPEQFTWSVSDRFDYGLLNPSAPSTPANRSSYNAFETGPDYYLHFSSTNTLSLGARYGNVKYSDLEASNVRYGADGRWIYRLSEATQLSLNYEVDKVDYENDVVNVDYRRYNGFLRMESQQARSHFSFDAGYTRIKRERGDDFSGPLDRLSWTVQLTSESNLGLFLSREYQDAGSVALSSATDPDLAPGTPTATPVTNLVSGDMFLVRSSELYYHRLGGAFSTTLGLFNRDFDYRISPLDRRESGGSFEIAHDPAGILTTRVFGSETKAHYADFVQDDVMRDVGAGITYRATHNLSFLAEGHRTRRSSTNPLLAYTDDRVLVSLIYSSGPLFAPAPRR